MYQCFFFNDTATTEIYTLSLHDALPIFRRRVIYSFQPKIETDKVRERPHDTRQVFLSVDEELRVRRGDHLVRSEEHTSELQSRQYLVCRLLLEKKKSITE